MKRLSLAIVFAFFFPTAAFSDTGIELDLGYSSPNKGLLGARFSPMPLSFGLILGSFASYSDFALAYSYHFSNRIGFYAFQSHHYLNSIVGNMWEINTGAGYQDFFTKNFLAYVELGIPLYIGGYSIYRHYKGGIPSNRLKNGDLALFELRAGFGVGYWFNLY
jgi:hypothetical protein